MLSQPHRPEDRRLLVGFAVVLVAVAALLRLAVAQVRFLQVDELQLLHLAWLRAAGWVPGRDYAFPQFSLLIDLLEPMWRLLGPHLAGVWVARTAEALVSAAIVWATWRWARGAFGAEVGLGAAVSLSLFTDFDDRSIEVRSDGLLVLSWILALTLLASPRRKAPFVAGLLAAAGLALNFKALAFLPFLALAAALPSGGERPAWGRLLAREVGLGAGLATGLAAYLAYLAGRGDLGLLVETVTRNLHVASAAVSRLDPGFYFHQSLVRNVPFYLLAAGGVAALALDPRGRKRWAIWTVPLLFTAVYVRLNPTFFPYNFVDVAPFWALAAGFALAGVLTRIPARLGAVALCLLAALPFVRSVHLLQPTLGDQIAVNRLALAVTAPGDRVYDASGLILFRRGPFHWRLHSLMLPRYRAGAFRLADELVRQPCRLFVPSYRTLWLTASDRAALGRLFPLWQGRLGVLGWAFRAADWEGGRARFLLLEPGPYRLRSAALASGEHYEVDGRPVAGSFALERGWHRLAIVPPPPSDPPAVVLTWSPPGLDREVAALPEKLELFYDFDY